MFINANADRCVGHSGREPLREDADFGADFGDDDRREQLRFPAAGAWASTHARELIVESHFDFKKQAVLYLPARMPDPRSREFLDASVEEIVNILEATRGRAFVLFTSLSSMRETYERVTDRIDFPTFIQGQGSKTGLLERFRRTEGAVLFATSSFWQGVDVQGEALSCVIISKLPFAVPSDPIVAARQKYIDDQGGNSFYQYSVPQAAISLKQGLGRLIRSTTDRGVLSVSGPANQDESLWQGFSSEHSAMPRDRKHRGSSGDLWKPLTTRTPPRDE